MGKTRLTRLASQIPDLFSRPMRPIRYQRMNRLVGDPIIVAIRVQAGMPFGVTLLWTCPFSLFISLQEIIPWEQASPPALHCFCPQPVLSGNRGNPFRFLASSAGFSGFGALLAWAGEPTAIG
jgi:hypothetical protein